MLGKRKSKSFEPLKPRKKSLKAIDEITFDFSAREDYLSGFHKRKLQRIKHAQEEAAKKDREERILARKTLREARKADLEKHVEEVNSLLRKANGQVGSLVNEEEQELDEQEVDQRSWGVFGDTAPIDEEAEYIDEDRHTTVTIEAVDVTREGLHKALDEENESNEDTGAADIETPQDLDGKSTEKAKRIWTKERPGGLKKKKKKFRYESKADRKVTRHKERSSNKAKARARKE